MMKTVIIYLIILTFLIELVKLAKVNEKDPELKQCMRESRRVLKQIVRNMGICNDQMKNQTRGSRAEHSKKMGCVVKCILFMEQILDEQEKVTDETIERAVGDRATGKNRVRAVTTFKSCNSKYGQDLDPKDEFCVSYGKFGNCIQGAVADLCAKEPLM